ncbi:ZN638 protein, partial [Centropus bengalensis]|nr:ZN638 protein [Centropus bengalensis]
SSGLGKDPEGSGVAQTAPADPPVEPSGAMEGPISTSNGKEEQMEPSKSHLDGAVKESSPEPAINSMEEAAAGVEAAVESSKPAATTSPHVKPEEIPLAPSGVGEGEAVEDIPEPKWVGSTVALTSEPEAKGEDEELTAPSIGPPSLPAAGKAEEVPPDHVVELEAQELPGAVPEVVPPASAAALVELASPLVLQTNKKLDSPEKTLVSDGRSQREMVPDVKTQGEMVPDVKTQGEMDSGVRTQHETPVIPQIAEKKPVLKTEVAAEKKPDTAGAETEVKPVEPQLQGGRAVEEKPEELLVKSGAEAEEKVENSMADVGAAVEDAGISINENNEGNLIEAHEVEGPGEPKMDETYQEAPFISSLSIKESPCGDQNVLKAMVCLPDISKPRIPALRNEPSLGKGGEQKTPWKPGPRGQAAMEKRTALKEAAPPRGGSGRWSPGAGVGKWKASRSCGVAGRGGGGRRSSQPEKESRAESRGSSKQSPEGESRASTTKRDTSSNKASVGAIARASRGGTGGGEKQKEDEELFPFKLDEFVTVDEVIEETESPVKTRRNPPRWKRKDGAKSTSSSEPSSKKRKGKSSMVGISESDLSFVTLDEIGEEEEDMAAQLLAVAGLEGLGDPRGLVVVDEVMEEEELLEAVKDPQSLVTLDELSEQEDLGGHQDVPRTTFEEHDLKAEPLVTVDEIGEVEELPLTEPTDLIEDILDQKERDKAAAEDAGDGASSPALDDPSVLVTVDEIQEDNEDNPGEALDEASEDDFLADFNRLKEDLNFVTVDEVGEEDEDEEKTSLGKDGNEEEEEEGVAAVAGPEEEQMAALAGAEEGDIVAVAGPGEMEVLGARNPGEDIVASSKPKGKESLVVSKG